MTLTSFSTPQIEILIWKIFLNVELKYGQQNHLRWEGVNTWTKVLILSSNPAIPTPCPISVNGNSIRPTCRPKPWSHPQSLPDSHTPQSLTTSYYLHQYHPGLCQDYCSSLLPPLPDPIPANSQHNSKSGHATPLLNPPPQCLPT